MIPFYVLTNDKHHWLLPPFMHLWNTYNPGNKVVIAGYSKPKIKLEDGFRFKSIAPRNYPVNKWTNGLIKLLSSIRSTHIVLMLEDYWLFGHSKDITPLYKWMKEPAQKDVLRLDLSFDRAGHRRKHIGKVGEFSMIESLAPNKYQMSVQAGIWNRKLLLSILKPNETPWQVEIDGTKRLNKRKGLRVLGTMDRPLIYFPVFQKGKLDYKFVHPKQVAWMKRQKML